MPKTFRVFMILLLFSFQVSIVSAQTISSNNLLMIDVVHHDILAQILPEKNEIKVVDVISFDKALSDQLIFLLHDGDSPKIAEKNFRIEKLSKRDFRKYFPNYHDNLTQQNVPVVGYRVFIPKLLPKDKSKFTLEYKLNVNHAIKTGGEESERSISESPGLILLKGIYLAGESLWYPRFDNELVTFRLTVQLPKSWKSVSQGERIYIEDEATYHIDTWQEKKPQDDIYLIAAKFTEYSQAAGNVNAMVFLREPDDALAKKYLDVTAQYMAMYQSLLGSYPYTKFALVENFWETGFGMPSFTLLGPQIIRFPFILHSSYPHELLHNWWGNSVYVDYSQGNWAEGLTAYLADHLIKEQKGRGVLHRRSVLQKYTNFTQAGGDFALKDFVSRYNAVTEAVGYGKTLMFFHMLRKSLGDEVFSSALKAFYMQYRYKVASFSDIEAVFSDVSGRDLSYFFDEWVNYVGAPDLSLENTKVKKIATHKYELTADIVQRQKGRVYKLDVPVAVSLAGENQATLITKKITKKRTIIKQVFSEEPIVIEVDPQFDLFRRLDLNETPPSLSQAFGGANGVIVLSSHENKNLLNAYESLAKTWQATQSQNMTVVYDNELQSLPKDKVVWLIGENNKFKPDFEKTLSSYPYVSGKSIGSISIKKEHLLFDKHSVVLVSRNPHGAEHAFVFISAPQKDAVAGLTRKLPHYGKYSYLGFEGAAPNNMLKGQWPIIGSPLTAILRKGAIPLGLKDEPPLITLSPVFSQNKMLDHIKILASESMKGRGLGTPELDKAATYISSVFQSIGLKQLPQAEGFYQRWSQNIKGLGKNIELKNVVGILPGSNPKYAGESVIVSAHYDHFGLGEIASRAEDKGKIHYGADDNASGVSIMLEFARLMAKKGGAERTIIFIAFTGEEENKLGSKYYVAHTKKYPLNKIMGVVNLDTVGRLGDNPISIFNTQTATEWVHIFRGVGFVTGIKIKSIPKNLGASDDASFVDAKVPAVHFFSGVNTDFHRPTDTVEKIDAKGLVKVAIVLKETVDHLTARENPLTNTLLNAKGTITKPHSRSGQRRVSLGTVPDFAYQGNGVHVTDIVAGSAAEKAGIRKGDVIKKINDTQINGLRMFSQFLKTLKAGESIQVELIRDKTRVVVKAIVTAR